MGKQVKKEAQLKPKVTKPKKEEVIVKQEVDVMPEAIKKEVIKKAKGKTNRLIIRNLVFDITEKHLKKLLAPYGQIVQLQVPKNPDNQKCNKGFAFVQFANFRVCQKVIKELNQSKYKGRPIVIDFSIQKTRFMAGKVKDEENDKQEQEEQQAEFNEEESELKQEAQVEQQNVKPQYERQENQDLSRTVFVRNLPANTEQDTLKSLFSRYGKVKWAKVVMDKQTKTSKGTAFIKFLDPQHARQLIEYSRGYEMSLLGKNPQFKLDPKITLQIDGTLVKVFPVEKRETIAEKISERNGMEEQRNIKLKPLKKIKKLKDLILYDKDGKRRIALAALGMWQPNNQMSQVDYERFKRHSKQKIEKLKNPNHLVSAKRIVLKYLDKDVSEDRIKEVTYQFLSANRIPSKQLKYCKLMLDNERKNSAGYAFVQFRDTDVSKMYVEQLAENQSILMPRPFVVEFSLQDSRKLKRMSQNQRK